MRNSIEPVHAIHLLSGGLDSQLAACLLKEQGVRLHGLVFKGPFFRESRGRAAAEQLSIPYDVVDCTPTLVARLNTSVSMEDELSHPHTISHAAMLNKAVQRMEALACHFVSTGEVLNQHAPAETLEAMDFVAKESGRPNSILRPLSAKRLPASEPETRGWVNRDALWDLEGRGQKVQLERAAAFGIEVENITDDACRLADISFLERLDELREHGEIQDRHALDLLSVGRHFRLGPSTKLVVGRNAEENAEIEGQAELYDLVLKTEGARGPTGLLPITANDDEIKLAAEICVRYSDLDPGKHVKVRIRSSRGSRWLEVCAAMPEDIDHLRV